MSYDYYYDEYRLALRKCCCFIKHDKIEGDYLEFGVFEGFSLKSMYDFTLEYKKLNNLRLFGFDSFEGFPENDSTSPNFNKGEYKGDYNKVQSLFNGDNRVELIKGYYGETLTPSLKKIKNITKASIINIDCDLYQSTIDALKFSEDLIQEGTLLILDDWFCFKGSPTEGEQGGFNEWNKNKNFEWVEFLRYGTHGKILLCTAINK